MYHFGVCILLSLGVATFALTPTPSKDNRPQRCTYQRAYGMPGAHCMSLDLYAVPSTLQPNIQILDLSVNRIRELRNTTFHRYTSLRFLYLSDNMIQTIEAGTFEYLTYLETLDLSLNGLSTIPEFILNLPSLRRLYMSDNTLTNLNDDLQKMEKPIKAPLIFLNIANCRLTEFPDFGMMVELDLLNISTNDIKKVDPGRFAKMCNLKKLDVTDAFFRRDFCLFKEVTQWFIEKQVTVIPEIEAIFSSDSDDGQRCPIVQFKEEDINTYTECHSMIKTKKQEKVRKKTWIIIGSCIGAALLIFILILYYVHRRNVKQTKKNLKVKLNSSINEDIKTTSLLSDVT